MRNSLYLLSVGMAMFSMFFGAGNVVFPLIVGQVTSDMNFWALIGLCITAVGVPFMGLFAMSLYSGDYHEFFRRLGKWPGFLIATLIMGLIGPFGAIPRCIALSHSTTKMFFGGIEIIPYSLIACLIVYLLTLKKNRIMDLVGWMLTPFFLLSIALIVVLGIMNHPGEIPHSTLSLQDSFVYGLQSGYNTMDLLGAFFFCSVVIHGLKKVSLVDGALNQRLLIKNALFASLVGAVLLAGVYVGMSYVSALHSHDLVGVRSDMLLGTIALKVLGPYAGILTCLAVVMACLTTAIALASVFAEFLQNSITNNQLCYKRSLFLTLFITFCISTLEFTGIVQMLAPCVQILYPGLVILSIVNVAYKIWGVRSVTFPVVSAFGLTLLFAL